MSLSFPFEDTSLKSVSEDVSLLSDFCNNGGAFSTPPSGTGGISRVWIDAALVEAGTSIESAALRRTTMKDVSEWTYEIHRASIEALTTS